MKGLQAASALVLLSFMVISPRVNAQTPDTNVKPQVEKWQVESTPNHQKALNYLRQGSVASNNREEREILKNFDEIIKIKPNNKYAYLGRGASYVRLGQYQQGKTDLDKSIKLDNSVSIAYLYRGVANSALGNKDNAITDFKTAANLFEKEGQTELAKLSREAIE